MLEGDFVTVVVVVDFAVPITVILAVFSASVKPLLKLLIL